MKTRLNYSGCASQLTFFIRIQPPWSSAGLYSAGLKKGWREIDEKLEKMKTVRGEEDILDEHLDASALQDLKRVGTPPTTFDLDESLFPKRESCPDPFPGQRREGDKLFETVKRIVDAPETAINFLSVECFILVPAFNSLYVVLIDRCSQSDSFVDGSYFCGSFFISFQ